ncbi:hypothetical protein IGI42_003893 [Enterococcus sp. AZ109]
MERISYLVKTRYLISIYLQVTEQISNYGILNRDHQANFLD